MKHRNLSGHDRRIFVALELTEEVPNPEDFEKEVARWVGEPVRAVIVPTRLFLTNKSGYPVLGTVHQNLLRAFFRFKIHIIVKGMCYHDPQSLAANVETSQKRDSSDDLRLYLMYVKHLHTRAKEEMNAVNSLNHAYNDYLQAPLQPLMDNLESQIYETFEQDPVKYRRYEEAIEKALVSLQSSRNQSNSAPEVVSPSVSTNETMDQIVEPRPVVIAVVGAGRGPLVAAAIGASSTSSKHTVFYIKINSLIGGIRCANQSLCR